jgi:ferredoxin-nitrite reductase
LAKKYNQYQNIFFRNMIACAGTKTCSFGVIDSKGLAIEMANFLQTEFPQMDGKIRFYWSGCPKGCGIHGVGDIGFEGCKTKDEAGNRVDGVHIFIGGKATLEAKEASVLYKALPIDLAKEKIKELVKKYQNEKLVGESFEEFHSRVTFLN